MADESNDIEKYLTGKLSDLERHALEKKALTDPFLADALAGAESIPATDFSNDVRDLNRRLKKNQIPAITPLRIAASIAIVVAASYGVYELTHQTAETVAVSNVSSPPASQPKLTVRDSSGDAKKDTHKLLTFTPSPKKEGKAKDVPVAPSTAQAGPRQTQAADENVKGAGTPVTEPEQIAHKEAVDGDALQKKEAEEQQLAEKSKADQVQSLSAISKAKESIASGSVSRAKKLSIKESRRINGKVTSADDGQPVAGALVYTPDSKQGAVTNVNGEYELLTGTNFRLDISSVGYTAQEVVANGGKDSTIDISLQPDAGAFSEVVIAPKGATNDRDAEGKAIAPASPVEGQKAYSDYLKKNLQYPSSALVNKTEGTVIIDLTVSSEGKLSNYTIIKGIGQGCDQEAIRLISEGPVWKPSTSNGTPITSIVRVKVKFRLP